MEQKFIPDFMKAYHDGCDDEGKVLLEEMAKRYETERQHFMQTTFVAKSQFQNDWNKITGSSDRITPDDATRHIREEYKKRAKELATAHGYQEKEFLPDNRQEDATSIREQFAQNKELMNKRPEDHGKQSDGQEGHPSEREKFLANLKAITERNKPQHRIR